MGLFGKKKETQAEIDRLTAGFGQVTQQAMARAGMGGIDPNALMQQAMNPEHMQQMAAYAAKTQRLNAAGVETPATITSISVGPAEMMLGGCPANVDVTIAPPGGAPYAAQIYQVLEQSSVGNWTVGMGVTVRVDPSDPSSAMLWGGSGSAPAAAAAAPAGDDRIERLTKLQDMRTQGLIDDDEFNAQKARILGS